MTRVKEDQTLEEKLDVFPPPWNTNPSRWSHRVPVAALAAIAFFISNYLALYQLGLISSVWDPVFGDQTAKVITSDVSKKMHRWMVIPDAALGALAYFGDAIFAVAGSIRRWQYRPWLVIIFGLDVIPLGIVSIILVILQGTVVGYWCFLCLVTAVISLILIVLAYDEVWSCLIFLRRVWLRSRDRKVLWKTILGQRTPEGEAVGREIAGEQ